MTATVSLSILITYLEYFGFVTRVNQKRAHDLVTRDINRQRTVSIVDDVQYIDRDSHNSENNMRCIVLS